MRRRAPVSGRAAVCLLEGEPPFFALQKGKPPLFVFGRRSLRLSFFAARVWLRLRLVHALPPALGCAFALFTLCRRGGMLLCALCCSGSLRKAARLFYCPAAAGEGRPFLQNAKSDCKISPYVLYLYQKNFPRPARGSGRVLWKRSYTCWKTIKISASWCAARWKCRT